MLEVYVSKENFKFNCAHFIAYKGFRERLHGHNYRVGVRIRGDRVGPEGYLIDFGDIKEATRAICSSLNEYFLCPANSDVISISSDATNICLQCEDGSVFSLPSTDCKMLPLCHTSAEEIAHYIFCKLVRYLYLFSWCHGNNCCHLPHSIVFVVVVI